MSFINFFFTLSYCVQKTIVLEVSFCDSVLLSMTLSGCHQTPTRAVLLDLGESRLQLDDSATGGGREEGWR